jgi:flagellar biosynthetic protein FliQ
MPGQDIVELARRTLEATLWLAAPLLLIAAASSLIINILQVVTSLQEPTISTVPRLGAMAAAIFLLLPWMVRRLDQFTVSLFSDFHVYLR